jgi:hypothetical protein
VKVSHNKNKDKCSCNFLKQEFEKLLLEKSEEINRRKTQWLQKNAFQGNNYVFSQTCLRKEMRKCSVC